MKYIMITTVVAIVMTASAIFVYHEWGPSAEIPNGIAENNNSKKVLYWVAPMDPSYRRDKPGKSPMGMDLVPVYETTSDKNSITIDPTVMNNLGVKTKKVEKGTLYRIIDTVGYVSIDERGIDDIHTFSDGWVRELVVKTTGETIKKGQLLMKVFSPTVMNAEEELLFAFKSRNKNLIQAGKSKLKTLGVSNKDIKALSKRQTISETYNIYAEKDGVLTKLNVSEGMFVKPEMDLMRIDDLSTVWVIAEVFERQANWPKVGQIATATLPYFPNKVWQGKVDFIYPELDPVTHTLKVRLSFPNPGLVLKPNMYASIKIYATPLKSRLYIPNESLIHRGDGSHVLLALGNGKFRPQSVVVGIESEDNTEIISGLDQGDNVVVSAQFLIDSESSLNAEFQRMTLNNQGKTSSTNKQYIAKGKILLIDRKNRTILLKHAPIPELNMKIMEMELPVSHHINLNKIKKDDEIHFYLEKTKFGGYIITKVHVMNNKSME